MFSDLVDQVAVRLSAVPRYDRAVAERADLPKATVRAPGRQGGRPKHVVIAFAVLSLVGVIQTLYEYTLYLPTIGLLLDLAWFGPLFLPIARRRTTTLVAALCLAGFVGQAIVFDLVEALPRLPELGVRDIATVVGIVGGLVASIVAMIKPDPDPDFVPNEFTIR